MGLGKTIQALTFIIGILTSGLAKRILIVVPLSLMANWQKELMKWSNEGSLIHNLDKEIAVLHGSLSNKKKEQLDKVLVSGGICFTTYGTIPSKVQTVNRINWDVVILDEGHKIKNHRIALSQVLRRIPSTTRILLTGTPIQNNLMV